MSRFFRPALATLLIAIPCAHALAQVPAEERPTITVAAFQFGAVQNVRGNPRGPRGYPGMYPGSYPGARPSMMGPYEAGDDNGNAFTEAICKGAADPIVEKLVQSERFRVFERQQLDAVTREQKLAANAGDTIARARYIVTGSVSHLGTNGRTFGGIATMLATGMLLRGLGGLSARESHTTVRLTARVVDTRTGEVIGSFTGEGVSKKRWGVGVLGAGRGGLGGAQTSETNFRETAIGEATTLAAAAVAERVVALRATTLRP